MSPPRAPASGSTSSPIRLRGLRQVPSLLTGGACVALAIGAGASAALPEAARPLSVLFLAGVGLSLLWVGLKTRSTELRLEEGHLVVETLTGSESFPLEEVVAVDEHRTLLVDGHDGVPIHLLRVLGAEEELAVLDAELFHPDEREAFLRVARERLATSTADGE